MINILVIIILSNLKLTFDVRFWVHIDLISIEIWLMDYAYDCSYFSSNIYRNIIPSLVAPECGMGESLRLNRSVFSVYHTLAGPLNERHVDHKDIHLYG